MFQNPTLTGIAKNYGKTVAQVILRFFMQSGIIVIPKSSRKERMRENREVLDFALSEEDMRNIEAMDTNESLFGWY